MKRNECWHVIMHFVDYAEAKAVIDASSLDKARIWKIELRHAADREDE